jgi:Secretion system C-terminal sorting domain
MEEALMTRRLNSKPESDDIHRFATIMRMLAVAVMILPVMYSRGHGETKIVWSSFGSGTIVQSDKGTNVVSMLGGPFVGSGSAGSIVLTSGFGTYILSKGVVSGIANLRLGVPAVYSLSQNYPNPFNPSTTIEYGLPSTSTVQLTVFDILGRNVATLYNGVQEAGYQRLRWDAPVSTGIYFYRIDATSVQNPERRFMQVKKMLLIK